MEDPKPASRYAKACQDCATTKAKCIRQGAATKCERCRRLNKECRARVTATRAPRPPRPNRLTQMERKLDGLVTLLAASQPQAQPQAAPNSHPFLTPNSLSPDTRTCEFGPIQIPLGPVVPLEEKAQKCSCSETPIPDGPSKDTSMGVCTPERKCQDTSGNYGPLVLDVNDEVAAMLLENYQVSMANYFPFVVIPFSTTAQQLRVSKPFLFLSVMTVSSYQKTGQQTTLSAEIMRLLAEKMLLKGEKSLDLLQGILVYTEWYHSHRLMDPQLTNILQLSIALLIDLGLNKAPHTSDNHQMATDPPKLLYGNSLCSQVRTNDERRAFLGCFYLTSTLSSCFKKLEALRYTAHVEESCNALSQNPEYDSDIYLIQLVKLQQIAEQITQTLPYDAPQSFWTAKPPVGMLVKTFQAELQSFQGHLPQSLQQDSSLLLHHQSTAITLHEIFLLSPPCSTSYHPASHLTHLHDALRATTTYLQTFLSLPAPSYSARPFVLWAQTLHALQVLARLSLLPAAEAPAGWDAEKLADEGLGLTAVLETMAARFEEGRRDEQRRLGDWWAGERTGLEGAGAAGGAQGAAPPGCRYELYSQRIKRVKAWYEGKLAALAGGATGSGMGPGQEQDREWDGDDGGDVGTSVGEQGVISDDFLSGTGMGMGSTAMLMGELDDAYWADFLGEWGSF